MRKSGQILLANLIIVTKTRYLTYGENVYKFFLKHHRLINLVDNEINSEIYR